MTRLQADLLLVLSAAIWGVAFVFQKTAMDHVGPITFVTCRSIIAAIALMPVAIYEARTASQPTDRTGVWKIGVLAGTAFFVAGVLQQSGIVTATVSNSGFLTALYVVIVPLLAWLWHRKAPGVAVWPAVAMSFAGTWLLGGGTLGGLSSGDTLVAISAAFWAAHVIIVGVSGRFARPVAVTAIQFAVVGALGLASAPLVEAPTLGAIRAAAGEIAYVGLLSSALTFTLLAVALRHTPPSEAAVLVSLETVFAVIAGGLLLGERLSLIGWIGAVLIFSATLVVQLAPPRKS